MRTRNRIIGGVLAASLFTQLTACGTLFYPDRRGQIEGRIDPAIALLNAVGLLFYVIPGLIAFGIDFATGAIYLPDNQYPWRRRNCRKRSAPMGRSTRPA